MESIDLQIILIMLLIFMCFLFVPNIVCHSWVSKDWFIFSIITDLGNAKNKKINKFWVNCVVLFAPSNKCTFLMVFRYGQNTIKPTTKRNNFNVYRMFIYLLGLSLFLFFFFLLGPFNFCIKFYLHWPEGEWAFKRFHA